MTIGIYKLSFENTSYVYIGQSLNIEARYEEHLTELRCGTCNYKMEAAYILFGQPKLEILLKCTEEELDTRELEIINTYDSINKGLNCFNGTTPRTNLRKGYIPVKSKYNEETYYNILNVCLANPDSPPRVIAEITKTDSITVSGIRNLKIHKWLEQKYPEKYSKLVELYNMPKKKVEKPTPVKKEKELYPTILSPDGIEYTLEKGTAKQFAKEHRLPYTSLNKLLNKKESKCAGWVLA